MRRIEYSVTLDGEPFSVASGDTGRPSVDEDNSPLPIKMDIVRCAGASGDINIVHAARLNSTAKADFARQYVDALMGESEDWKLTQFQVSAEGATLQYYHSATGDIEDITLCINGDPVRLLYLEFKVPHQDGRPDAGYRVEFNYHRFCKDEPFHNDACIVERLPSAHRRTVFSLDSLEPDEMSITEYVDL